MSKTSRVKFRVPPSLFLKIQKFVVDHGIKKKDTKYRQAIPADIITAFVLRRIATGSSFFDLSMDFGVGEETVQLNATSFMLCF